MTTPKEELIAWQSRPMEIVARCHFFIIQLQTFFLQMIVGLSVYFTKHVYVNACVSTIHIFDYILQVNLVRARLDWSNLNIK